MPGGMAIQSPGQFPGAGRSAMTVAGSRWRHAATSAGSGAAASTGAAQRPDEMTARNTMAKASGSATAMATVDPVGTSRSSKRADQCWTVLCNPS